MPELTQEEYDELIKFQRIVKFQLQEILDTLRGRILPNNIHNNAIGTRHMMPGSITDEEIEDAAIIASKIANDAVTAIKIATSAIDATKFADTIKPIEVVDTLPEAGTQGRTVFLTTDNKIYRDTGIAWTVAVVGTDITANTIEAGQIKAGAIGTDQLAALAVTAAKIAANTITASQIYAGTIGADQLAVNAVTADKIKASAVTTVKLDALAITGAKIAAGTITANKYNELRNTYVFNGDDSLDNSFPFELDFEIVSEMTAINKVLLSFRISQFRAYSKAGAATGTPSGGGATSGATGSASGGGSTSGSSGAFDQVYQLTCGPINTVIDTDGSGYSLLGSTIGAALAAHTHSTPNHTHPNHTHTTPNHTHPNHTHTAVYGIFEDSQTPTIHYYIDNGAGYGAASGAFTTDQLDIDITGLISGTGFKRVKFVSDVRCRVRAWVLCKIDLSA